VSAARWIQLQALHRWIELRSVKKVEWVYRVVWYGILWLFVYRYLAWCRDIPPSGKAVLALAMLAALMPIRSEFRRGSAWHGIEKSVWIMLLFAFFYLENVAIDTERVMAEKQQQETLRSVAAGFQGVLSEQQKDFSTLIDNGKKSFATQQQNFGQIVKNSLAAQKQEREDFAGLLKEQKGIIEQQHEMIESLNGRLLPGDDPMPSMESLGCNMPLRDDDYLIITGGLTSVVRTFPYSPLSVSGGVNVMFSKSKDGMLVLSIDIRDRDHSIIVQFSEDGFAVNPNLIKLHPDKSTLIVENLRGDPVLKARYINKRTFSLEGKILVNGKVVDIPYAQFDHACLSGARGGVFVIR
jgi:hypothetical protein